MKKFFVLFAIAIFLCGQAFGYNYDAQFKKSFYDGFVSNFFISLQESLLSQGFKDKNVSLYISTLRARLDRSQLEKETWACVSKYPPAQLMNDNKIVEECFGKWTEIYFFDNNKDALELLK